MTSARGNFLHTAINNLLVGFSIFFIASSIVQLLITLVPFDPTVAENKFNASQWVVPNSAFPISDQELYIYSGYRLINGYNPIYISPEVPPLGKYLIGLSIVLTGHYAPVSILFFLLAAYLTMYITRLITHSSTAGYLALFFTATHPIYLDQIREIPQLDIFQVVFFLSIVLCLIRFEQTGHRMWILAAGAAVGAFVSTKAAILYGLLMAGWLGLYFVANVVRKKRSIRDTIIDTTLGSGTAVGIFLLSYSMYFIQGGTLYGFLGVQKWIYTFYQSSDIQIIPLLGNYLLLIVSGYWWFWTPGYPLVQYEHWSPVWLVVFVVGWISVFGSVQEKNVPGIFLLVSFIVVYSVFLFVIPMYPRYLVLLFIPFHIMIGAYFGRILHNGKTA